MSDYLTREDLQKAIGYWRRVNRPSWEQDRPLSLMPQSELVHKQCQFTRMIGQLIDWAYSHGYELAFGEAFRTEEQAKWYAEQHIGIENSLHKLKLAVDFYLFKDGEYKTKTKDYEPLGLYWESLGGAWGGRFGDGDHFSLEYHGVK